MILKIERDWDKELEELASRVEELENNSPETFGVRRGDDYIGAVFRLHTVVDHFGFMAFSRDIDIRYLEPAKMLEARIEILINRLYPSSSQETRQ